MGRRGDPLAVGGFTLFMNTQALTSSAQTFKNLLKIHLTHITTHTTLQICRIFPLTPSELFSTITTGHHTESTITTVSPEWDDMEVFTCNISLCYKPLKSWYKNIIEMWIISVLFYGFLSFVNKMHLLYMSSVTSN